MIFYRCTQNMHLNFYNTNFEQYLNLIKLQYMLHILVTKLSEMTDITGTTLLAPCILVPATHLRSGMHRFYLWVTHSSR